MHPLIPVSIVATLLGGAALTLSPAAATRAVPIPTVASDVPPTPGLATAVLAGGCFWGMEAVFEHVKGVKCSAAVGAATAPASRANSVW